MNQEQEKAQPQKQDIGYVTVPKKQLRWLLEQLQWIDGLTNGEELAMIEEWLS